MLIKTKIKRGGNTKEIISEDWIHHYKSDAGGWNRRQLKAIGILWPPCRGWLKWVVGKQIIHKNARVFENSRVPSSTHRGVKQ